MNLPIPINRLAALVFASTMALASAVQAAETVATGLNNPRGLNFGPDGRLYVAESGLAGGLDMVGEAVTYTGAITRIDLKRHRQEQFLSGLLSLQTGGEMGEAVGPVDVDFNGGEAYFINGLGFARDPAAYPGLATLYRFNQSSAYWPVADLGQYEFINNPDQVNNPNPNSLDSNPNGLLALPGRQFIADAGANAIIKRKANGQLSVLTVLPRALFCLPTDPPGCVDTAHDPVSTTVTQGPDGAYYSSQLYSVFTPTGDTPRSTPVYRIKPDGSETEVYADGFGAVIDIAFDRKGRLFVLEIFANGFPPFLGPGGGLWQINRDGSRCAIAGHGADETLNMPGGIAVGKDGDLYVTDNATSNGGGVVLKFEPCDEDEHHHGHGHGHH